MELTPRYLHPYFEHKGIELLSQVLEAAELSFLSAIPYSVHI